MTKTEIQQTALDLPPRERQELVEVLWESLEAEPAVLPAWQHDLLDERLADLDKNPEQGSPWEEVEKRIWPDAR